MTNISRVQRMGNSLGIRIPHEVARQLGWQKGQHIQARLQQGSIVVTASRPRYRLSKLLAAAATGEKKG